MKRWCVTFAGAGYDETVSKIVEDAPRFGADETLVYDDLWLRHHPFYELNRWIFDFVPNRCVGFCSWKPLLILETFKRAADGDVVLYTDGDCFPVGSMIPLFDIAEREGVWLARASAHQNRPWCKRDAYVILGQDDDPKYIDMAAGCARYCAFQKGPWMPFQLLAEWMTYSVNRLATTKSPSKLGPEHEGFYENRDEQAILTLLAHRYGIPLYREACDAGNEWIGRQPGEYGQVFQQVHQGGKHHPPTGSRFRNVEMPEKKPWARE